MEYGIYSSVDGGNITHINADSIDEAWEIAAELAPEYNLTPDEYYVDKAHGFC